MAFLVENDPKTFSEVMSLLEAPFWNEVVKSKFDSIMQNYTWYITYLPHGCGALGNRWIMKRKLNRDGNTWWKYKDMLVVQDFGKRKASTILIHINQQR